MFAKPELLSKYNQRVPRYTSYPTALQFSDRFSYNQSLDADKDVSSPLSLYIHIPFCKQLCYYCGCNKIVTRHQHRADEYIQALHKEMRFHRKPFSKRPVSSIHFGGGSPNFLTIEQFRTLFAHLRECFAISETTEISVECDPRWTNKSLLDYLFSESVSRISMGVQDTNLIVQQAINRVQDTLSIKELVAHAHSSKSVAVNLDLIYGLPFQSHQTFKRTLADVIAMKPDRISLFNYAHLPERFPAQRKIDDKSLPSAAEKLGLMQMAHTFFAKAGYQAIGLDHFALTCDPLYQALLKGKLHRNFQGYSVESTDILGLGSSAISQFNDVIVQNHIQLKDYLHAMESGNTPHHKGIQLDRDDLIRRYVICELMCNLQLDKLAFYQQFNLFFDDYFKQELDELRQLQNDGIVELAELTITIPKDARLFARNVCSKFDAYLHNPVSQQRFSRAL